MPEVSATTKHEVMYPYATGSGLGNRSLDILSEARGRGAAVGAFTVYNLEGIRAVVGAAEATGRSAILQVQYCGRDASCLLEAVLLSGSYALVGGVDAYVLGYMHCHWRVGLMGGETVKTLC